MALRNFGQVKVLISQYHLSSTALLGRNFKLVTVSLMLIPLTPKHTPDHQVWLLTCLSLRVKTQSGWSSKVNGVVSDDRHLFFDLDLVKHVGKDYRNIYPEIMKRAGQIFEQVSSV